MRTWVWRNNYEHRKERVAKLATCHLTVRHFLENGLNCYQSVGHVWNVYFHWFWNGYICFWPSGKGRKKKLYRLMPQLQIWLSLNNWLYFYNFSTRIEVTKWELHRYCFIYVCALMAHNYCNCKGFSTFPWVVALGITILPGFVNCGGEDGCLSHCFTLRYNGEPACLSPTCSTIGYIDKT